MRDIALKYLRSTDDTGLSKAGRVQSILALLLLLLSDIALAITLHDQQLEVNGHAISLRVPAGLKVEYLASLDGPRFLTPGPGNELLIGSNNANVYRLAPPYNSPETLVTLPGKNHSIAYRNGRLFVAETSALYEAGYTGPYFEQ